MTATLPSTFRRANYSGYLLLDRPALLDALAEAGLPPAYERLIAEHVTHAYPDPHRAPRADVVQIVGHAADDGVQALLVSVEGSTRRPDGRRYHLTYSLAAGHKPVESNALLNRAPVTPLTPVTVPVVAF